MSPVRAVVFNDTRPAIHFGCERVMDNLTNLLIQSNIEPIHLHSTFDFWENQSELVINKIKSCDLVIVNGEGSIHHSNAKAASLSSIGPLAKSLKKPAILLNTTLYKNNENIYKNISEYDLIYVRDTYSASEFAAYGGISHYAPDLTFFTDIPESGNKLSNIKRNNKIEILVGESVIKDTTVYLNDLAKENNYSQLQIHHYDEPQLSIERHWEFMRSYDLIITGRFHTVCFCINMGIPFIAMESNTNKIFNLLNDCLNSNRRLLTKEQITNTDWKNLCKWNSEEENLISHFSQKNKVLFQEMKKNLLHFSRNY